MDPLWLLLLLPVATLSGWITARREKRTATSKNKLPESYFKGLNLLLNEQPDQALRVFLEAVAVDSKTMELHLALGNLFRRRGDIEKATRIHQNLVERADLAEGVRILALFELAQDYFKAGLLDRAEKLFQKIRHAPEYRKQANRFLLQIYDQEKEWNAAILVAEELTRISSMDLTESLAQYCCELAEKAIADGQNKRAEEYLNSAFRYNSSCVRAVIQSGRLSAIRGHHNNAIHTWRSLEKCAPEAIGEVVDHLANSYAVLGDQKNYKQFLADAVQYNPDWRIITALAELAKDEQENQTGKALLFGLVQKYPFMQGVYELIKSRATSPSASLQNTDFTVLVDLILQIARQERDYLCDHCGFSSKSLHWQCPGCKIWGSVQQHSTVRDSKPSNQFQHSIIT